MRNRTIGINVRVSENEKKKLQRNAKKCNLNLSSYLRKSGLQKEIYEISEEELRKMEEELKSITESNLLTNALSK